MPKKPGMAPLPEEPDAVERLCEKMKTDEQLDPNIRYFFYVLHHKYCVYRAGRFLGLGIGRLLIHDWQKLTSAEWKPYVDRFYRSESPRRADGGYDPTVQGEEFTRAFHHHVAHGSHHWQYWLLPKDDGGSKVLEMKEAALVEMLADWMGAGRAIAGTWSPVKWYQANAKNMHLHGETRGKIHVLLPKIHERVPK